MKQFLTYQLAFFIAFAIIEPVAGFARETGGKKEIFPPGIRLTPPAADTVLPREKPGEAEKEVKLPDIKEVPKSRRQVRPLPVPAPIPIKPIKVIKPKIIRPKVGLTL
jgi:hypothetical protein